MATDPVEPRAMLMLSCGHAVYPTRTPISSITPPLEWCHECKHARVVSWWV